MGYEIYVGPPTKEALDKLKLRFGEALIEMASRKNKTIKNEPDKKETPDKNTGSSV